MVLLLWHTHTHIHTTDLLPQATSHRDCRCEEIPVESRRLCMLIRDFRIDKIEDTDISTPYLPRDVPDVYICIDSSPARLTLIRESAFMRSRLLLSAKSSTSHAINYVIGAASDTWLTRHKGWLCVHGVTLSVTSWICSSWDAYPCTLWQRPSIAFNRT